MSTIWLALPENVVVHKYNIIGTSFIAYTAYTKEPGGYDNTHATLTSHPKYGFLGDISTLRFPQSTLPYGSPERIRAVDDWYKATYDRAVAAIKQAFPQDFEGEYDGNRE